MENNKNKVNFYDIMNNLAYFEMTENGKDFFNCIDCGYIPKSKIDTEQTKFLDIRCKCGAAVILASFEFEELEKMVNDCIELQRYKMLCQLSDD